MRQLMGLMTMKTVTKTRADFYKVLSKMIDVPLNKLLFFDLETVGVEKDYTTLNEKNPEMGRLFESYRNWFDKKVP